MHSRKKRKRRYNKKRISLLLGLAISVFLLLLSLVHAIYIGVIKSTGDDLLSKIEQNMKLENLQPDKAKLKSENALKSYEDAKKNIFSKAGIDVSSHQGNIDWDKIKSQGIDFVMVRIGYRGYQFGKLSLDDNFQKNVKGAQAAGLGIGIYFFSQALEEEEATKEAEFVLKNLKGMDISYPVVYDQEEYPSKDARTNGLTGVQATKNAIAFCKRINQAGYKPMIYMNNRWAKEMYKMKSLKPYLIWYADYTEMPITTNGYAMWQYSSKGMLEGIESETVDLNILFWPKQ